ncbi:hypothetical protein J2X54_004632 [Duganella sp. 3397]|uniref:toxin n=1 Tax=Duganella sp. 3397 TaxID=2817732 RepID=UPI002864E009|nr:toxin [Duganella sp. 3397]MDR7052130.1 hypothetical protein [Duganella sp. 3397]
MDATFVELPPFERHRAQYFNDEEFRGFQRLLLKQPDAGAVIQGTGGLRKVRFADSSRQKGKRVGLRVIDYHWVQGNHFWLFAVYGKDVQDDLNAEQKKVLRHMLNAELQARTTS